MKSVSLLILAIILIKFQNCSLNSHQQEEYPPNEIIMMFMKEDYDSLLNLKNKYNNISNFNSIVSLAYIAKDSIKKYEMINNKLINQISIDSTKIGKVTVYSYKLKEGCELSSYDAFSLYLYLNYKYKLLNDFNSQLLSYAHERNKINVLAEVYLYSKEGFSNIDQNINIQLYIDSLIQVYPYWLDLYRIKMDDIRLRTYNTIELNKYGLNSKEEIIKILSFLEKNNYYKNNKTKEFDCTMLKILTKNSDYLSDSSIEELLTRINNGNYFLVDKFR